MRGLDAMTGLGRPLVDTCFSVNITVPALLRPFVDNIKEINYRCLRATTPGKTVEKVEVPGGDKVASTITYTTGRIIFDKIISTEFLEGNLNQVKKFVSAWIDFNTGDYKTGLGSPITLKTILTIKHFDGDVCVDAINCYGAQLTKLESQTLELKENATPIRRRLEWTIDSWEPVSTK